MNNWHGGTSAVECAVVQYEYMLRFAGSRNDLYYHVTPSDFEALYEVLSKPIGSRKIWCTFHMFKTNTLSNVSSASDFILVTPAMAADMQEFHGATHFSLTGKAMLSTGWDHMAVVTDALLLAKPPSWRY